MHFPHLSSDASRDFSSGSSLFLAVLRSPALAPSLPPSFLPSAPVVCSAFSSVAPAAPFPPLHPPVCFPSPSPSHLASSAFPPASVGAPPSSAAPSAVFPPVSVAFPLPLDLSSSSAAVLVSFGSLVVGLAPGGSAANAVPGSSAFPATSAVPFLRPLFCSFDSPAPVPPGAPGLSSAPSVGAAHFRVPSTAPPGSLPPPHCAFGVALDDLPEDDCPDAVPRDLDPAFSAGVSESFRSEFRRMLFFIVDLFPQAAGFPSVAPPPRALFEDFFTPLALPQQPIFLNRFERVRAVLADADSRMAASLVAGRSDYSFIPSRSPTYEVYGDFAQGRVVPLNPSLLSLFERSLEPSLLLGLWIREDAALEASVRGVVPFHVDSLRSSRLC